MSDRTSEQFRGLPPFHSTGRRIRRSFSCAANGPSLPEYIDKHPELADEIRELFPAMVEIEQFKEDRSEDSRARALSDRPPPARSSAVGFPDPSRDRPGGMGIVFEAEQVSLGRSCGLEGATQEPAARRCAKRRFERKAKSAARLHHTNIVPVFGVGEHEGVHYSPCSSSRGSPSNSVLHELRSPAAQRGRMAEAGRGAGPSVPVEHGPALLTVTLADGLRTGRFQGEEKCSRRPHRGRPPSPVVDSARIRPKWTRRIPARSFRATSPSWASSRTRTISAAWPGWACRWPRLWRMPTSRASSTGISSRRTSCSTPRARSGSPTSAWPRRKGPDELTSTGDLLGTLRYMAPERFQGQADPRSDVFSLGLTLYEMVTLRPGLRLRRAGATGRADAPHRATSAAQLDRPHPP